MFTLFKPGPALILPLCLALFSLSGCVAAAIGGAGAAAVAATQERTVGETVDDTATDTNIKLKLLRQQGLGEVSVKVSGGLVLLTGRVATQALKMQAESLAKTAPLIEDVANEIRVEPRGSILTYAADNLVSTRVQARLIGSKDVRLQNIIVHTYAGTVYLMGIARNQTELEAAAVEASKAGGVKQVVSFIRLRDAKGRVEPFRLATGGNP